MSITRCVAIFKLDRATFFLRFPVFSFLLSYFCFFPAPFCRSDDPLACSFCVSGSARSTEAVRREWLGHSSLASRSRLPASSNHNICAARCLRLRARMPRAPAKTFSHTLNCFHRVLGIFFSFLVVACEQQFIGIVEMFQIHSTGFYFTRERRR